MKCMESMLILEEIKNRYAGYLNDLIEAHRIPVVVAEFGLPSSRGVGRITNSGMDQGLHTETSQGEKGAQLLKTLFQKITQVDYFLFGRMSGLKIMEYHGV